MGQQESLPSVASAHRKPRHPLSKDASVSSTKTGGLRGSGGVPEHVVEVLWAAQGAESEGWVSVSVCIAMQLLTLLGQQTWYE